MAAALWTDPPCPSRVPTDPLLAHAKVNLALRVLGRFANDYHRLEMVNVEISLADDITIHRVDSASNSGITITVLKDPVPGTPIEAIQNPETSSLGRAFNYFCEAFGVRANLDVKIKKRIPTGAGLGGGTADAAVILSWCRDHLLSPVQRHHPSFEAEFLRIAARVGADVPYSLQGGCALVTGIGEAVAPLPWSLQDVPLILIIPPVSIPTPTVFATFREQQYPFSSAHFSTTPPDPHPPSPRILVMNDLEAVVSARWHMIGEILAALRQEGANQLDTTFVSSMSGSGSALFCLADTWNPSDDSSRQLESSVRARAPQACTIIPCRIR